MVDEIEIVETNVSVGWRYECDSLHLVVWIHNEVRTRTFTLYNHALHSSGSRDQIVAAMTRMLQDAGVEQSHITPITMRVPSNVLADRWSVRDIKFQRLKDSHDVVLGLITPNDRETT